MCCTNDRAGFRCRWADRCVDFEKIRKVNERKSVVEIVVVGFTASSS